MIAVLPGRPRTGLQTLAIGLWNATHFIVYISGNSFTILSGPETIVQTVYDGDDGDDLEAIAFDEASGKIATCTNAAARIYKPFRQDENRWKWELQFSFQLPDHRPLVTGTSLSWGASEELLVASASLSLYFTAEDPICCWAKALPTPASVAQLSFDSAYIASAGQGDCLVKVWRRLTYGAGEVRFELAYLRHPRPVAHIQWRRPYHAEQSVENVLYTVCIDNVLRVWTGSDVYGGQQLHLWGSIDFDQSVREQSLHQPTPSHRQWVFIIDGRDISAATEQAIQARQAESIKNDESLDRLISIATKTPEICVLLSGSGCLSTWALENVSCRSHTSATIVNATRATSEEFQFLDGNSSNHDVLHNEIYNYCDRKTGHLYILVHSFDGKIHVYETSLIDLFQVAPKINHLRRRCIWSGHAAPIRKMVRNFSGHAVVSRTAGGETIVWKHFLDKGVPTFARQSVVPNRSHIHRMCVLRKGRFLVVLMHDGLGLWDCRQNKARLLDQLSYTIAGKPLCLLILPRHKVGDSCTAHIATITSSQHGIVWEVKLPRYSPGFNVDNGNDASVNEFCRFQLTGNATDLAYVLPVDPAGASPLTSGFLDIFARDVAVSYTRTGRIEFWAAKVDSSMGRVDWLSTSSTETGVSEPALVSGSTLKKAALVDSTRSQLSIWDVGSARLEFAQDYEVENKIQDLDWTSTPDSQSILAVGFQHHVILLSQMRFDYLNKGPAWAPIREISIRGLTPHPIGDSTWLGDGYLIIGAGNQMFVHDRNFDLSSSLVNDLRLPHRRDGVWDLFEVVQRFNGPLPVFHPQFLSQCILAGKSTIVRRVLIALSEALKYHVRGETLDDYLGLDIEEFYMANAHIASGSEYDRGSSFHAAAARGVDGIDGVFSEATAATITEQLTRVGLSQLSGHEQFQLADIIECMGLVEKHRRSMDENGARFMLFFRQHALRKGRTNEMQMSWREINWAYHSTSQDILVDFVARQYHGRLLWEDARESGMFMWLSDHGAVKTQFELIARNEYTKSDTKDPVECSLFYLALRKKAVLQGLWRMAGWHREQVATQKLLANNFEEPKWRTVALKNAYALLSKRRFEYAAAFFILAGQLQDAVNVCLNQLKDLQLAVAVARVYEGDHGPVLRRLLEEEVLAVAAREGNRWLASWAFWMLGRKDMAVRALITPVYTLLETPCSPDMQSKLFLTDDPALVVLYSQLRQTTLQTLRGASKVTPKVEWEFVLHSAKLYDRMGCDILGLDLVRNWEFPRSGFGLVPGLGGEINPLKLLRRRSSLVVADLPVSKIRIDVGSGADRSAAPAVFQEPDSNSLLDSFGF